MTDIRYIKDSLINERKQCSFMIIEGQGYLNGNLSENQIALLQDIMDSAYERTKVINRQLEEFDKV